MESHDEVGCLLFGSPKWSFFVSLRIFEKRVSRSLRSLKPRGKSLYGLHLAGHKPSCPFLNWIIYIWKYWKYWKKFIRPTTEVTWKQVVFPKKAKNSKHCRAYDHIKRTTTTTRISNLISSKSFTFVTQKPSSQLRRVMNHSQQKFKSRSTHVVFLM